MDAAARGQVLAQMRFRQQIGKEWRQPRVRGARLLDETPVRGLEAEAGGGTVVAGLAAVGEAARYLAVLLVAV